MANNNNALALWRQTQCKLNRLFVHDLKNPISALSANLNFLESVPLEETEDVRGALTDSILAANMLLKLVENFDLIALLESKESFPLSHVNMADFIRAAANRNKALAASAGVRLVIKEPLPNIAQTWQNRYAELVVDNLIMSSVRHSPHGADVSISLEERDGELIVTVTDQGQPIAEEYREGLFTRESQVEAKKNPGCRYGRGLGLYAVGLGAQVLNGRLSITETNNLSTFSFIVPISAPSNG
jgi:two-component system, OmpR family, sensor histidine kinase VicK